MMIHTFIACAAAAALSLSGLKTEFEKIAKDAKGRVGVAVMLLESRESADLRGDEHFPMRSASSKFATGRGARDGRVDTP
jgi:beta-lactamase class A